MLSFIKVRFALYTWEGIKWMDRQTLLRKYLPSDPKSNPKIVKIDLGDAIAAINVNKLDLLKDLLKQ